MSDTKIEKLELNTRNILIPNLSPSHLSFDREQKREGINNVLKYYLYRDFLGPMPVFL